MLFRLNKFFRQGIFLIPRNIWLTGLSLLCCGLILATHAPAGQAQSEEAVETQEEATIQQYSLPESPPEAPVVQPRPQPAPKRAQPAPPRSTNSAPATPSPSQRSRSPQPAQQPEAPSASSESPASETASSETSQTDEATAPLSQYVLQFNRSPVVGNALQMEGVLSEARVGFTRPQHWDIESAKVQIRFRHSPALFAERSSLTVRLNNVHLGSVPLNRDADDIGNVLFNVPVDLIQDYNAIVMQVQQHTSPDCTDPTDPALWTEILPDSQVVMNYRPQAIALDLANYPYPFLDELGLDADRLTYSRPESPDDAWLTATARYQAAASRLTNFRTIQTRVTDTLDDLELAERLVVIGTPSDQPLLSTLALPFDIENGKLLDGGGNALPNDVGVVMLTTTDDSRNPVLVMTGNDGQGVLKAVQAMVQPQDRQLLTGSAAIISEVADVETPDLRDWATYLPREKRRFALSELETENGRPFQDVMVNGLPVPPPISIPFKALPGEQILKGSTFTLRYSYGPNIDPARSSVSIRLDGQGLGGERLRKANGGTDSVTVDIPPDLVTPASNLDIQFFTYPKASLSCGDIPDQPMWGTVHGDSSFKLNRTNVVDLPDLKLMQTGFPVTAPQDLSQTAFVLPDRPTDEDLLTMLYASGRFGSLSRAESVQVKAYLDANLPSEVQRSSNLVGIGTRDRFPLPELFDPATGFALGEQLLRRQEQSQVQTLSDQAGVIEAQVSPWNSERILLGLTGQSAEGLENIQAVLRRDSLFSQLTGDTLLVERIADASAVPTAEQFKVTALDQNASTTIDQRSPISRLVAVLQANWFLVPGGLVLVALVFYGLSQLYLNRLSHSGEA